MKKLLLIMLSALSLTAFAQQKKVAVYVTGEQSGISKVLGDKLVEAFVKNGKFAAIERTTSFLAEISKEQSYQRAGAVSDNEIARLGAQFGVQYVCVVDISDAFGEKYISTRLINVESAEIVQASNMSSSLKDMDELLSVTNKLTKDLTAETAIEIEEDNRRQKQEVCKIDSLIGMHLKDGYFQVGSLYVTYPLDDEWVSYEEAVSMVQKCRNGGWSDWRLPRSSEINEIRKFTEKFYNWVRLYPEETLALKKINAVNYYGHTYWVLGGHQSAGWLGTSDYISDESRAKAKGTYHEYKYRVMLVRDMW